MNTLPQPKFRHCSGGGTTLSCSSFLLVLNASEGSNSNAICSVGMPLCVDTHCLHFNRVMQEGPGDSGRAECVRARYTVPRAGKNHSNDKEPGDVCCHPHPSMVSRLACKVS
jgi:hypothetical protein